MSIDKFLNSSIGKKQIVAATGLLLILYVFAHLTGNLFLYGGPQVYNHYARSLASLRPGLYVLEFGLLAVFLALSVGIWFSALNLQFTDFRHIAPLFIQLWFFATPIFYPASLIPEAWQPLYRMNPMVGVVESVRWAIFHSQPPELGALLLSLLPFALIMAGGLLYFGYFESTFAENL